MIKEEDIKKLKESLSKENEDFANITMSFLQNNDILSSIDLENLQDRAFCRTNFHMDYAAFKEIPKDCTDLKPYIKDKKGRNRYYASCYTIKSKIFVMTSQLYGPGKSKSHKVNTTPFINFILDKIGIPFENPTTIINEVAEMSIEKEKIANIKNYIKSKGFTYEGNLIENFYLSLKSKPFVILAGTSGTGKTRLAKLFAEGIGASFKLVPVRPDWSDSSDLFGHVNLNGKFVPGAILDFIKTASLPENSTKPYFLCLDEMNLARVEYYMSDFLSIIETRDFDKEKHIISDPLMTENKYGSDDVTKEKYGSLNFPENLYIIGTVNMDETTFPFSKKVLDRANTIEFSLVDLMPKFDNNFESISPLNESNDFLKSKYLKIAECKTEATFVTDWCEKLAEINKVLEKASLHVGYRVRDEIIFYLLNNKEAGNLISNEDAFDNELMQKILPRIQGSSQSINDLLCSLFKICAGDFTGIQTANNSASEQMQKYLDDTSKSKVYKKSAAKIQFMTRRLEEDGFTSYWL